jgi:hypothetical protein
MDPNSQEEFNAFLAHAIHDAIFQKCIILNRDVKESFSKCFERYTQMINQAVQTK